MKYWTTYSDSYGRGSCVEFQQGYFKMQDRKLLLAIRNTLQTIESASSLADIPQLKKLKGTTNYFRIRISDYRMGIFAENNKVTIVRFLHRKEIYRYFP
jgi:mRNA interferase RelE/StbE